MKVLSNMAHVPTVITFECGDLFYTRYAMPDDIERYARANLLRSGEVRLIFRKKCLAVVEEFEFPYARAGVISFVREDRSTEGIYQLYFAEPREDTELREALWYLGMPQVHAVTGLPHAILYGDELLIVGFEKRGAYGWLIKRTDAESYKEAASKLRNCAKTDSLRIWRERHRREDGTEYPLIRIEGWSEIPDPAMVNKTLCAATEYSIVFEAESRIVRSITLTNEFVGNLPKDDGPLRSIRVGRPLPGSLARNHW